MVEVFIKLWYLNGREKEKIKFPLVGCGSLSQDLCLIWEVKKITSEKRSTQLTGRTLNKMYTAPTEDDFAIINSFWDFRIENGDEEVGLHQMLLPYSIIAYNTHQVELKKRIFDFKMTANSFRIFLKRGY